MQIRVATDLCGGGGGEGIAPSSIQVGGTLMRPVWHSYMTPGLSDVSEAEHRSIRSTAQEPAVLTACVIQIVLSTKTERCISEGSCATVDTVGFEPYVEASSVHIGDLSFACGPSATWIDVAFRRVCACSMFPGPFGLLFRHFFFQPPGTDDRLETICVDGLDFFGPLSADAPSPFPRNCPRPTGSGRPSRRLLSGSARRRCSASTCGQDRVGDAFSLTFPHVVPGNQGWQVFGFFNSPLQTSTPRGFFYGF